MSALQKVLIDEIEDSEEIVIDDSIDNTMDNNNSNTNNNILNRSSVESKAYLFILGRMYKRGQIKFSDKEAMLFEAIFRGREDQKRMLQSLGEAIHEVQHCEDIEKELEWWK